MPPILRVAVLLILRVSFSPKLPSVLAIDIANMTTVFLTITWKMIIFSLPTVQWILRKVSVILAVVIGNVAVFGDCIHSER